MTPKAFIISTAVFVLISISYSGMAQNDPNEIVQLFFEDYQKLGASEALDKLYFTNDWMDRAAEAIEYVKTQIEELNEDFVGKYYGYELMVEKKLAKCYILQSYLVKYDRQPIRFTFQFYKPNDKWMIYSFQFDGNITTEIEEAAKLHFQNLDE